MPKFEFDQPQVSFAVPDRPTVRQQLAYKNAVGLNTDRPEVERWWLGALTLIQDWECPDFPDMTVNLDEVDNPTIGDIIIWAGSKVRVFISELEDIPKNS